MKHSRMRLEPSEPQKQRGGLFCTHTHTNIMERKKSAVAGPFSFKRDGERGDRGRAVDIRDTHNAHTHTLYPHTRIHACRQGRRRREEVIHLARNLMD